VHVHIELFGRLHNTKVKADMPSENSRKATLKRKTDRRGYVKHSTEVAKQMKTAKIAKVIDATYKNIALKIEFTSSSTLF
jgi:hypothetical protein